VLNWLAGVDAFVASGRDNNHLHAKEWFTRCSVHLELDAWEVGRPG
jgi:hypothetical protein